MAQRLLRTSMLTTLAIGLLLGGGPAGANFVHTDPRVSILALPGFGPSEASAEPELRSAIAFSSTRDDLTTNTAEIYLMLTKQDGTPDPTQARRLTNNTSGEGFAALSPNGKQIVFDSDRMTHLSNSSDLFVMEVSDSDELQHSIPDNKQMHLTRGSSASWSPDSKYIAYHASKKGKEAPEKNYPGAPTVDSDIFVMNPDDCATVIELNGVDDCRAIPGEHFKNLTNNGAATIDDDPGWSADGGKIVFVRHAPTTNRQFSPDAEIWVMNPDGSGQVQLTFNSDPQCFELERMDCVEERGPTWSPDGKRIAYACRKGVAPPPPAGTGKPFEICVMNADGSGQTQLTDNLVPDFTPTWSPDGTEIVFHSGAGGQLRLMTLKINPDGTVIVLSNQRLTDPPGFNVLPSWGVVRARVRVTTVTQTSPTNAKGAHTRKATSTSTPTPKVTPTATPRH